MSSSSISKLASVIFPPTTHGIIIKNCAGETAPRRDCNCSSSSSKSRCLSRCVSISSSSIPKPPIASIPPTTYRTIIKNCAGETAPRRDCYGCSVRSQTAGKGRCCQARSTSIPKPPIASISPTGNITIIKNSAGMSDTRSDCNCSSSSSKTRYLSRCVSVSSGSISKLAKVIPSPTTYRTIIKNGAGVVESRRDCNCSSSSSKTRCLSRCVSLSSSSFSKSASEIPSPTTYSSIIKDSAGMITSRRECNCSSSSSKTQCLSRCVSISISSISKLAIGIAPPTTYRTIIKNCAGVLSSSRESRICINRTLLETWNIGTAQRNYDFSWSFFIFQRFSN